MPLGSIRAPSRGSLAPIDLQWEKHKKFFFSETTRPRAFIFCQKQCIVVLFINPANLAPGVHTGPVPGALWEKLQKIFFSETTRPKAFIFCVKLCIVVLFINPANLAPGVHMGPAPGGVMGKT